ncbi:ankyrin repeat domain-containing protein [Verrucomicrobia bacterium]|nr:ankyrin repeat domain-containing protein [Verrucomicrobiota bacterium]
MKNILITTIAAVVLVGCGLKKLQKTKAIPIQQAELPTTKAPEISIHAAAHQGNIEVVKKQIASGTDVNAKNSGGWTPLHSVATKEIAELLISRGADVNAKGKIGITPLDLASRQPETVALLRKHGGKTKKELEAAGN